MNAVELQKSAALRDQLGATMQHSADARFIHRLHCVLLVAQGNDSATVGRWFNCSASTISRWVRQYEQSGIAGLQDTPKSGRPATLTAQHLRILHEDIRQSPGRFCACPKWDGKCLQSHLEQRYGVSLGIRQCQRLLKKLMTHST